MGQKYRVPSSLSLSLPFLYFFPLFAFAPTLFLLPTSSFPKSSDLIYPSKNPSLHATPLLKIPVSIHYWEGLGSQDKISVPVRYGGGEGCFFPFFPVWTKDYYSVMCGNHLDLDLPPGLESHLPPASSSPLLSLSLSKSFTVRNRSACHAAYAACACNACL